MGNPVGHLAGTGLSMLESTPVVRQVPPRGAGKVALSLTLSFLFQ